MLYVVIFAILVLPWLIIPINSLPDPTRLIKATVFDFSMMAIIVCGLIYGLKFKYRNKYLGWLSAWIFVGIAFNWYIPLVRGYGYNAGTIEASLHFILALVATIFICSQFEGEDFIRISKSVWLSVLLVSSFGLLQAIGLDPLKSITKYWYKEHRHVAALLDHPDLLGGYLAIYFPILLYFKGWKYWISMAICLSVILFTKSSLSIVAVSCGTLMFYFLKYRRTFYVRFLSIPFIFGFLYIIGNPTFNKFSGGFTGRIDAWKLLIDRMNNYAFGMGLGSVKTLDLKIGIGGTLWTFAHNDYIEIFCALGALGLVLFSLVITNSFRNFNYKPENVLGFSYMASFVAFLIVCIGSFPMEIAPLALGGMLAWIGVERLGA